MTTKKLHLFIHETSLVAMNVSIFILFYTIDVKLAVTIGGLYCIKTISSFLYSMEQKREDQEMMEEIDRILKCDNKK